MYDLEGRVPVGAILLTMHPDGPRKHWVYDLRESTDALLSQGWKITRERRMIGKLKALGIILKGDELTIFTWPAKVVQT
jgi:hypothetical protein